MSAIGELDESNATLRLLMKLSKINKPIIQRQLYDEMLSEYGLGRRVTETAIQTCDNLGLIKKERKQTAKGCPMLAIFHSLTPKGKRVSAILFQLEKAL